VAEVLELISCAHNANFLDLKQNTDHEWHFRFPVDSKTIMELLLDTISTEVYQMRGRDSVGLYESIYIAQGIEFLTQ